MRRLAPCLLAFALAGGAVAADGYSPGNQRPMLGVEMSPVPLNVQTQQGISNDQGVLVRQVFDNTAAAGMGVQPGDVILSVNGAPISSMTDLRNEVGANNVGDPVSVVVRRGGKDVPLTSELREWPTNIPNDPIDAEAERRFKDWQQRRLARNRSDIREVADQARELRERLQRGDADPASAASPFIASPAVRDGLALLRLMPAWTIDYRYDTGEIAPAPGALPPVAPVAGESWALSVDLEASKAEAPTPREL